MLPRVSVIHPGTQHASNLARELNKLNLLSYFVTSIGWTADSLFIRFLKRFNKPLYKKLFNRILNKIEHNKLVTYPLAEIKLSLNKLNNDQKRIEFYIYRRNAHFQKAISVNIIERSDIIIGFDTSSWIIAAKAKDAGKKFILDQTIGHPLSKYKLYSQLDKKHLARSINSDLLHKSDELLKIETFEHSIADAIVVPSNFVKDTLISNGVSADKIYINRFGIDQTVFIDLKLRNYQAQTVKFLFVGTINTRKGIPDLLQAWEELNPKNAELQLVGTNYISEIINPSLKNPSVKFLGRIEKHQLPLIYCKAHIFIFPSYFEGLAQVQLEALSCGLPVIGTTNSGAEDIIIDGYNGFIVEPGNIMAIKKSINYFLNNREKLLEMSKHATKSAADFGWEKYGERWKMIIDEVIAH